MELKELSKKICDIFHAENPEQLPDKIMEILFRDGCRTYMEKYKELCPDLKDDLLRKVYQFYNADREVRKQDFTPSSLARLVALLSRREGQKNVYDCCAGSGSLTVQMFHTDKNLKFICEELDEKVIPFLLFNLCVNNIESTVINKNVLTGEVIASYKTVRGKEYGAAQRVMFPDDGNQKADVGVSNPPFNIKADVSTSILKDLPGDYTCNFAFVSKCLQMCERLAIILPLGVLTNKKEETCRRYFVKNGWLQAAVSMPENMFDSTSVATCILVFDKGKKNNNVMLVDATKTSTQEVREQRGEGANYNRVYKKILNTFTDEQIFAICSFAQKEQDGYSMLVTPEQLEEHGYNLTINPYLPIEFEGTVHRDFNEIISDINRVIRERNVVKVTVNKVWADRLNLTDVIMECEANNEIVKAINESFSEFENYEVKQKIIENKYIQSSNSKVFVIENTDKEILSSIMPFFMNMYKQHIYYLNNEENRLLAELRDSMLPFLMNGQLTLKNSKKTL